jgi:glycerate kinase
MAAAAGLSLVPKDQRNPFATTTFGVGKLIKAALDAHNLHSHNSITYHINAGEIERG